MENSELYIISFKGLTAGSHEFDWTINGGFFAGYEMSEISDAHIEVQLTAVKHKRFIELKFNMHGWAEVSCDRCLDPLRLGVASDARIYVKFGDQAGEDDSYDSDVIILPHDEEQLDAAQYLYEYAHLSLPMRRVHPDDASGRSTCNADMLHRLKEYSVNIQ